MHPETRSIPAPFCRCVYVCVCVCVVTAVQATCGHKMFANDVGRSAESPRMRSKQQKNQRISNELQLNSHRMSRTTECVYTYFWHYLCRTAQQ